MKKIIMICLGAMALASCAGNKHFLERTDEDRALSDAIKKINKAPGDEEAITAIPVLYNNIKTTHLAKIKSLENDKDISRWDKIIKEYEYLQVAYDAIMNSTAAFKLVNAKSYSSKIYEVKQSAAEDFYSAGNIYLDKTGRDNAKKAYQYFIKSDKYVSGYKDAQTKSTEAFEKAIVHVVINPIQDNSFFFNSGLGNYGYNYSNEYFQQTLVKELSSVNKDRYPARFYSDWQARRDDVKPDWTIDLKLRNMDIPYPSNSSYSRNASSKIQVGTDTSGRPVYQTVFATINIIRSSFTARADMEISINEVSTGKTISYRDFREDYRWQEERATYNGDSRALSSRDWELVNNNGYRNTPRKEEVLNELYKKIYRR